MSNSKKRPASKRDEDDEARDLKKELTKALEELSVLEEECKLKTKAKNEANARCDSYARPIHEIDETFMADGSGFRQIRVNGRPVIMNLAYQDVAKQVTGKKFVEHLSNVIQDKIREDPDAPLRLFNVEDEYYEFQRLLKEGPTKKKFVVKMSDIHKQLKGVTGFPDAKKARLNDD
jgi:hypothetical protein